MIKTVSILDKDGYGLGTVSIAIQWVKVGLKRRAMAVTVYCQGKPAMLTLAEFRYAYGSIGYKQAIGNHTFNGNRERFRSDNRERYNHDHYDGRESMELN
jgi:hypothetical protein